MGLGLSVSGDVSGADPDEVLGRIRAWCERHVAEDLVRMHTGEDVEGRPTLFVTLHPSAEDVEITAVRAGVIGVNAKTSTTGPGYHAYLCDLLEPLGEACGIRWRPGDDEAEDETGYLRSRDEAALEAEFLGWLRNVAAMLLERAGDGSESFGVSMPMDVRFSMDAFVTTPLGPRTVDWAREVAREPRRGIGVFPWWERGKGARYALGRALTHMWMDVPWRAPLDESEAQLLRRVDTLLTQAQAQDPSLALPRAEWAEIRADLGESAPPGPARGGTTSVSNALIGYRRHEVWNALTGGWSLRAPGVFVGKVDGEGTWSAFDGRMTLWFSSFQVTDRDGRPTDAAAILEARNPEGERVKVPLKDVPHRATLTARDDGDGAGAYRMLQVEVAAPGSLGVLTAAFADPEELSRAQAIAGTIAPTRA